MVRFSFLASAALLAARAFGQQSSAMTDSNTGITFQGRLDPTGFYFGMALPETPGSDFIGQIVSPLTDGEGWGAVALGGAMTDCLLVVAWPNGDDVMASIREATGYTTPAVASANATLEPIASGTFVNSTHVSYTFLCKGCITGDSQSFNASASGGVLGWAYSDSAVTTPSSVSTALSYHSAGYGLFGMIFSNATSTQYDTWAAMASPVSYTSSGNSSTNSTTGSSSSSSSTGTNTTATVSNSTYDYIVAGAGAAGIVVAERLAESGASVLLIERGGASTYATGGNAVVSWNDTVTAYDVPALSYYLTSMDGTADAYCTDTADEAGCLLGGGTMVNALMFVRPQEADFDDNWPTGWKWADVQDAAERFYSRNPGTLLPSADGKRYDQGAYNVLSEFFTSFGFSSVNALEEPNKKHKVFSHPPWDIQDGERAGPVKSYLPKAQALSNFKLSLNTKVIRAVREGSTITGVEIETAAGARQIIKVNTGGKVILAAGTLSTPRILFNSGIGPKEQIQTVANGSVSVTLPDEADWIELPVGKHLMDHPIFTLEFTTKNALSTLTQTAFTSPSTSNIDLFAQGNGVLTQSGQRLNFWTSVQISDGSTRYFQGTCNAPSNSTIKMKIYLTHGLTSTGELGITSDGATTFITNPWMNTDGDKEAITTFLDSLLAQTRLANSTLTYASTTGGSTNVSASDLISSYITGAHYVGTARMGASNDGSAVVDTDTKVFGTDNLFVVDGSIHPDLPTGNTQAIIMVAAEKAAEKILALGSNSTSSSGTATSSASPVAAVTSAAASSPAAAASTPVAVVSSAPAAGVSAPAAVASSAPAATSAAAVSAPATVASSAPASSSTSSSDDAGDDDDEDCSDDDDASSSATAAAGTSPSATSATASAAAATSNATVAKKYYQCGGSNWTGPTTCEAGSTCKVQNEYYSQCV